jgi:hypothetical protein
MRTIDPFVAQIMPLISTGLSVLTDLSCASELGVVQDLRPLLRNGTDAGNAGRMTLIRDKRTTLRRVKRQGIRSSDFVTNASVVDAYA